MNVQEAACQQGSLPTLLTLVDTCPCTSKSGPLVLHADGNKTLIDQSEKRKLQRQKSLAADLAMQQKLCQAQWAEKKEPPKSFQPKAESLQQRWSAASKIKAILSMRLKSKKADVKPCDLKASEPTAEEKGSSANACHKWQDEPNPPDFQHLEALMQLESILLKQHGSMTEAFKHIAQTSGRDTSITKRDLRVALHFMSSKDLATGPLPDADKVFTALLFLFRSSEGEISCADFLRFPELVEREKAVRLQLLSPIGVDDVMWDEPLLGDKLAQRLASGVESPEAANELLQKLAVALKVEPRRTANILMERGKIGAGPAGGVKAGLQYIVSLTDEFGAPKAGTRLTSLIAGWALCDAFTRQAIALGALPRSAGKDSAPSEPVKSMGSVASSMMKVKKAVGRKMKKNVTTEKLQETMLSPRGEDSHENACRNALWEALPPGKVLWNVAHGAETLNEDDFEQLLCAAWAIFDSFNAVEWLLGPVGITRLRPKLDELAALRLRRCAISKDLDDARAELVRSHVLLQQIATMCVADPRLASTAALYGVPFLAERARCCANASVNLVAEEAVTSQGRATAVAAAQLNRVVASFSTNLMPHVEEMLGGRKFDVKVARTENKQNPLAQWHYERTRKAHDDISLMLSMGEAEYRWGKILSDPVLLAVEEESRNDVDFAKALSAP